MIHGIKGVDKWHSSLIIIFIVHTNQNSHHQNGEMTKIKLQYSDTNSSNHSFGNTRHFITYKIIPNNLKLLKCENMIKEKNEH